MVAEGVRRLLDPDGFPLGSLKEINRLPAAARTAIYRALIPRPLWRLLPPAGKAPPGEDLPGQTRFVCPEGIGVLRIEVRRRAGDRDCVFFVEIADTPFGQVELSFCLVNDPAAPRFDTDRDGAGRDNDFATLRRNVPEEVRAMRAGLSPHQVRRGLGLFAPFFTQFETFVRALGVDTIVAEPLSYGNAVRYERYGFDYITGRQLMLWIDREFRPGGILHRRLDGSTPFRQPGMEATVRGRSWAIHDGILDQPWDGIRIYKIPGVAAGICTFSGPG